jgi:hypothetical protein
MKWFRLRPVTSAISLVVAAHLAACAASGGRDQADADTEKSQTPQERKDAAPKVGDDAPRFTLKMLDDKSKEVELAGFFGKRPVVLFFGSYT